MAPPVVPNNTFRTINGTDIIIRRNTADGDDYGNLQQSLTDLAGTGGRIFVSGTVYSSYMLEQVSPDIEWHGLGEGGSKVVFGLPDAPILPLDTADRNRGFSPGGWPFGLLIHPAAAGGSVRVVMRNITFQAGEEGVKGYDGTAFFGIPMRNMHVQRLIAVLPSSVSPALMDVPITMTGVAPLAIPGAISDIASVGGSLGWVFSAIDNGGTEYVEGVDYTIDAGARTIQRTGGSTIPDVTEVYLTTNQLGPSENAPSLVEFDVDDSVKFRGTVWNDGDVEHMSMDTAISFLGAYGVEVVATQGSVSFTGVITQPGIGSGTLRTDNNLFGFPQEVWNGVTKVEGATVENCSFPVQDNGGWGVPVNDGGMDYSAARARCLSIWKDVKEIKAHSGAAQWVSVWGNAQGHDFEVSGNEAFGPSTGHLRGIVTIPTFLSAAYPGVGFVGAPNSSSFHKNKIHEWGVVPDPFGGFQMRAFEVLDFGGSEPDSARSCAYLDNEVTLVTNGSFRNAIDLSGLSHCLVAGNKFKTAPGVKAATMLRLRTGTVEMRNNDVSQYELAEGAAHYQLDAGVTSPFIQANDLETYVDNGAITPSISGGIDVT